jgi:hypothetical protein
MAMTPHRELMIAALKDRFVPMLRQKGFVGSFPHFLSHKDDVLRALAARALGRILPKNRDAVVALTRSLSDPHAGVQTEAALALAKIGPPPDAIPTLRQLASNPSLQLLNVPGFKFEIERAIQHAAGPAQK